MKTALMEKQKLGSEPISKLLLKMSVPMILAMVINGMYYLVDAVFVGWGVGSEALGGLAVIFPLQMLAIAIGMAIGKERKRKDRKIRFLLSLYYPTKVYTNKVDQG